MPKENSVVVAGEDKGRAIGEPEDQNVHFVGESEAVVSAQ